MLLFKRFKNKNKGIKKLKGEKNTPITNDNSITLKELSEKEKKALKNLKNSPKQFHQNNFTNLKTQIPGFDDLFEKGIPKGNSVLVEGGPGSGKTILCLNIAHNACKQGLKTLYMSFEEKEDRLRHHMKMFGWDPREFEKKGLLKIKRFNALDIARSVEALLSEAKRELLIDIQPVLIPKDFEPDIVCIDSLTSIASAFSGEQSRFRIYMEQFFRYLEKNKISAFLIRETPIPTHLGIYSSKDDAVSFLSDGIIVLYNVFYNSGKRGRAIEVLKMRGENINRRIVEAEIVSNKGVIVYPNKYLTGNYKLT
jgi:KaiC/GvpD/RAD55 family RecA-like ATPase